MRLDVLNQMILMRKEGELVNKAAIARAMNCDPRTVKRYLMNYQPNKFKKRKKKLSKLDDFKPIVTAKLEIGCTGMAIFKYLQKQGYKGSYSLLQEFIKQHKRNELKKATIRFESSPGLQAQVDWKESIKMVSKYGEVLEVNIFLMVLGYSRMKFLKLTTNRTQETLFNCMNDAFRYFKGVPKEILFDNMSTVVDRANSRIGNVKLNIKFSQYAKDVGFNPITCRIYRPQTKGKVESLAKLVDRLKVYNHEFEDYQHLEKIVKNFMKEINSEVSQAIGSKPIERFQKETKYLLPLPKSGILKAYLASPKEYKVSKESMIMYKGKKYSVPTHLIGKVVSVKETTEYIHIYYTTNLIAIHRKEEKFLNYRKEDAIEILKSDAMKNLSEDSIEAFVLQNICNYDEL